MFCLDGKYLEVLKENNGMQSQVNEFKHFCHKSIFFFPSFCLFSCYEIITTFDLFFPSISLPNDLLQLAQVND